MTEVSCSQWCPYLLGQLWSSSCHQLRPISAWQATSTGGVFNAPSLFLCLLACNHALINHSKFYPRHLLRNLFVAQLTSFMYPPCFSHDTGRMWSRLALPVLCPVVNYWFWLVLGIMTNLRVGSTHGVIYLASGLEQKRRGSMSPWQFVSHILAFSPVCTCCASRERKKHA